MIGLSGDAKRQLRQCGRDRAAIESLIDEAQRARASHERGGA
jgi:hypothetical protein